jgi:threonine dehydrogenase-like Zn-dependent dehydrogenase
MKGIVLTGEWKPRGGYVPTKWEEENHYAPNANLAIRHPKVSLMEDIPTPKISGDHEVFVKVHSCGICGSDVHMVHTDADDYIMIDFIANIPLIIGHEFSGVVEEVGKAVTRVKPGDPVAIEEVNWCGRCLPCHLGYFNQCENVEHFGFSKAGALAEYVVADERHCWSLQSVVETYGRDVGLEVGALTEPTGVAYEGLFKRANGIHPGGHVVVYGAGPIGLAAIQLMKTSGAAKIICFELSPQRRELARISGADAVYDPEELEAADLSMHEKVLEDTGGEGAAMHIEAAGAFQQTFPEIEKCLRVGSKVVVCGMLPEHPKLNTTTYQLKGAELHFAFGHCGGNFGLIINLMAAKRMDPRKMITARFPLAQGVEAIHQTGKREDGKVLVQPGL